MPDTTTAQKSAARADDLNARPPTILASTLTSAKSLIALQLLSRLITFSLNQSLIRIASPKVFGTVAVQFDLVRDTVLFLSREGVRAVVVRVPGEKRTTKGEGREWMEDSRVRNLVNLPIILGLLVAGGLLPLYLRSLPSTTTSQPFFHTALGLYVAATLLELSTEPFYLLSQLSSPINTSLRVQAEGIAIVLRAVVTVGCLAGANEQYALLAFAIGQMTYSIALGVRYSFAYWRHPFLWRLPFRKSDQTALLPLPKTSGILSTYLYPHHTTLLTALLGQSTIKHFLTEADRIVVARASPLEDQAGYAIASNYASLVARIVFQPIEESVRVYFAREVDARERTAAAKTNASPFLLIFSMFRISIYLLLLCLSFVPPLSPVVLPYLLPHAYAQTSAFQTLTAYLTLYLPILGMNGILEAFFAATSGVEGLGKQSGVMVLSSGTFAGTLSLLAKARRRLAINAPISLAMNSTWLKTWTNPEVSLVYANALSMLVRIIFALRHSISLADLRLGTQQRKRIRMVPAVRNVVVLGTMANLVRLLVKQAEMKGLLERLVGQMAVVGGSVVMAFICLGTIYIDEQPRWKAAIAGVQDDERKRQ